MSELNLFQKIVEVRKSIETFKKDTEGYGYNYVSGSQILSTIKDKMDELGLVLYPKIEGTQDETYTYQAWDKKNKQYRDKTDFIIKGDMKYIWVNADKPDETLEVDWKLYGQQDDISKAFGSASTYSERYFLLKFFNAPTDEDDPDAKQTNDRGTGKKLANDKQLNFVDSLLNKKVNEKYSKDDLFQHLTKQLDLPQEMTQWTSSQASQAIEKLKGAS